jgi:hypothetical protein
VLLPPTSLLTAPVPYPKIVLVGFAAGGSAGKASDPALPSTPVAVRGGPRDAGLDVGAEHPPGVEAEDVDVAHEMPPIAARGAGPAARVEDALAVLGLGRPGKPFADEAEADPHDALRDAEERDDWAVEDLSLRTREVLFDGVGVADGVDEVTWAQPRGKVLPLMPLGPGRDG